jgi:hypothetical protein
MNFALSLYCTFTEYLDIFKILHSTQYEDYTLTGSTIDFSSDVCMCAVLVLLMNLQY